MCGAAAGRAEAQQRRRSPHSVCAATTTNTPPTQTTQHTNTLKTNNNDSWAKFAAISVPWLTKLANAFLSGQLEARQAALARDAVDNLEQLGPTFLKLAQILSIR